MYKIGEFSKITTLTVKALRYYDEQGILEPSNRTENDYRLYDEHDFQKARMIVLLRSLNFSIAEMKDVMSNCSEISELSCYLIEKKTMIENNMIKERKLIQQINTLTSPNKIMEDIEMSSKFEIKEVEARKVISIRFRGSYSDVGKYIGKLYKAAKNQADGAPFNLYYDADYQENADIELCVPVKGPVSGTEFKVKVLPQIKALCTTHYGNYDSLNLTYKKLIDYAKQQGYQLEIPSREIYEKGPGMIFKGNPEKYETVIMVPLK